jgi:DNA (cytosine-5)-methyltransferase 1
MRYLSICSGIEAATVAWHPLGWQAAAFAEIDKFPSAVLAHHYPDIPNVGDFTAIKGDEFGTVDLLVGGTPCQSFSVAGLRGGLDDHRGNLTIEFIKLAERTRPRWLVWENVPGVLSIDGGRTFGAVIGGLAECGYGFAWRVLNAQYFGVPQRRRRVFVVGHLGDWRPAAAVLFERHCLSGDTAPRRKTGQEVAGTFTSRSRSGGWSQDVDLAAGGYMQAVGSRVECEALVFGGNNTSGPIGVSPALNAHGGGSRRMDFASEAFVAAPIQEVGKRTGKSTDDPRAGLGVGSPGDPMYTLQSGAQHGVFTAHTLRGEGFDASEDGTGRANLIPINLQIATRHEALGDRTAFGIGQDGDPAFTLTKTHSHGAFVGAEQFPMTFAQNQLGEIRLGNAAGTLNQNSNASGRNTPMFFDAGLCVAVRRLTPQECEKLQGFEPGHTLIPWRGKPAEQCPDGPRYKAIGNSMAVPVMRWIGKRIDAINKILEDHPWK